MAGNLSVPFTFNTESGNQPASQLDTNFGNIVTYVNAREITQNTLAARPAAGVSGRWYFANDTLQLFADTGTVWTQVGVPTGLGSYTLRNLIGINNAGTPNTKFDLSADLVVLRNPSTGGLIVVSNTGVITNDVGLAGSAANGRDQAGAFGASTWLHFYFIHNGATLATLSSLTAPPTGPALPAGYTHWAYVGAVRFDGASHLVATIFSGAQALYNSTPPRPLTSGQALVTTSVGVTTAIPPNAVSMNLILTMLLDITAGGLTAITGFVGPTNATSVTVYQGRADTGAPPALNVTVVGSSYAIVSGVTLFYINSFGGGTLSAGSGLYIDVAGYRMPNGGE